MAVNDFSKGSVTKNILRLAVPMMIAQLVNVLYNVIDRFYISRMPQNATLSMTGLGLVMPIITIVLAFANLFGMGGAPLFSITRGKGDMDEAEYIMGNSFLLLVVCGVALTFLGLMFQRPLLYLFGASDATYPYAKSYITIYLLGSIFVMISLGMNSFINAQGFGKMGMGTVLIGAVLNIILDPIFIFVMDMGIEGAALATIISQGVSAMWVLKFLFGKKAIVKITKRGMVLKAERVKSIVGLGLSGFMMQITNGCVQIAANINLQFYGGDIFVAVMTVLNSIREIISTPFLGVSNSSQPVIGYNYGAGEFGRVKTGIKFVTIVGVIYTTIAWACLHLFPVFFIKMFNTDPEVLDIAVKPLRIFYFGFIFQSLQFCGQSVFVALGKSKQAVFFSLLRKVIIVVPLTIILPRLYGLGTTGVFMAEPISNVVGGLACFITMLVTVGKELGFKNKNSV